MSRILYITRKYPPSIGGMEKLSYEISTRLREISSVSVVAWGYSQLYLPFFLPYAVSRATIDLLRARADVLYVGDALLSPLGVALGRLFGTPTVVTVHGLDVAFANAAYQRIVPGCLRHVDLLICISTYARDKCLERGIPSHKCRVIRPGVEIHDPPAGGKYGAKQMLSSLIQKPLTGQQIMLTVGRLVPRKGVLHFVADILPALLQKCPNVHYIVIGEGPQKEAIERTVQALGLGHAVSLLGGVDASTLRTVYDASDLFLMPNLPMERDVEGFGLVALEAAAAGLWVVASKVDGIPDAVVDGENGFLIEPGDTDTYVEVISSLLTDREKTARLGDRARDYVKQNYSWDRVVAQYGKEFEQLIRGHSNEAQQSTCRDAER
ncbi:MAG: glycosyltransferase family 4 protein [Anaerolineae bacterium]|nr:glycosyltransferase family 4 protein [Anaerolineae bacterium]